MRWFSTSRRAWEQAQGRQVRLDQAKSQALDMVDSAAPGERFAVVGFAAQAEVLRYFTADLAAVRSTIKALRPYDVAAAPAALAAALMRVRDADRIELFAPRLPAGAAALDKAEGTRLRYHQIGVDEDNVAITALDAGYPAHFAGTLHAAQHVGQAAARRPGYQP